MGGDHLMFNLETVLQAAENSATHRESVYRVQEIRFTDGYAEPGYPDTPNGLALGNWNDISHWDDEKHGFIVDDDTMPRLARILEHMEIETDWSDEYEICSHCYRAVRSKPDSYSWSRSYWDDYGDIICHECLFDNEGLIREYLESLEGDHRRADTLDIDLEEYGYRRLDEEFQNGLYGGQADDPELVAESLREQGEDRFIFTLDYVRQFDIGFSVWVPEDSTVDSVENVEGPDPAEMMKKAMESMPSPSYRQGEVQYSEINLNDGSVKTRVLTPEEFVKGVK
jgi:hypothetical protein